MSDREKQRICAARWYLAHRAEAIAASSRYARDHREEVNACSRAYKARRRAPHIKTAAQRRACRLRSRKARRRAYAARD